MKTIGLIGGMSWESSLLYYRIMNELVKERLGPVHSCQNLMYSVDFAEVEARQTQGDWAGLTDMMISAARRLQQGGADCLLICANTMHKTAEAVERHLSIPLLHIADATGARLIRLQCYEGLDESKALYEWNYRKQLLRIQGTSRDRTCVKRFLELSKPPVLTTRL